MSSRIDWRRVVLLAIVMAMAAVLVWRTVLRDADRRNQLAEEPAPPPPPVTDVSQWHARQLIAGFRDQAERHLGPGERLLFDECGRAAANVERDAVRLTFADAWDRGSFTVGIVQRGDGAVATWHRISTAPPPPPAPPARVGRTARTQPASDVVAWNPIQSTTTHALDAAAWARVSAAVRDRAFSQLDPGGGRGLDGYTLTIETCTDDRYHLVQRFAPHGSEHRAFLDTVRVIEQAGGLVHSVPEHVYFDPEAVP